MPEAMIERINHLVREAITSPTVRQKLSAQLMEPIPDTPADFRARVDAEISRWKPVIDAAKIQLK
jgi:tripartite-type tricarboxylate transporter receptor subunit TctC